MKQLTNFCINFTEQKNDTHKKFWSKDLNIQNYFSVIG